MSGAIEERVVRNRGEVTEQRALCEVEWFDGSALVIALEERRNRKASFGTHESPIPIVRLGPQQYRWADSSRSTGSVHNTAGWMEAHISCEWNLEYLTGKLQIKEYTDIRD